MAAEKNISPEVTVDEALKEVQLEQAKVTLAIEKAKLEAQQEELETLKFDNEDKKQKREAKRQRLANAVRSQQRLEFDLARKQAYCNHTQGGEGLDGLFKGEGIQTTFQKETTSLGEKFFRCIRCEREVRQDVDPKEFARIDALPHKGLRGPIPITFRFVDERGRTVEKDAVIEEQ
jgi:hypothetical protein